MPCHFPRQHGAPRHCVENSKFKKNCMKARIARCTKCRGASAGSFRLVRSVHPRPRAIVARLPRLFSKRGGKSRAAPARGISAGVPTVDSGRRARILMARFRRAPVGGSKVGSAHGTGPLGVRTTHRHRRCARGTGPPGARAKHLLRGGAHGTSSLGMRSWLGGPRSAAGLA